MIRSPVLPALLDTGHCSFLQVSALLLLSSDLTVGDPPALPKRQTPALQAPAADVQNAWDEGVLVHLCPKCCNVSHGIRSGRSDRMDSVNVNGERAR